jgi:hypothetical protein
MDDDACCGSKPARWRYRVLFTKEWIRHGIPEEPVCWGRHSSASLCLGGPTKNIDAPPPARNAHANEIKEKAGSISDTFELPWPVRGDMKKRLATKPVWGRVNRPRVQRQITRMRVIMTAANCSPAVACRRAKYDEPRKIGGLWQRTNGRPAGLFKK